MNAEASFDPSGEFRFQLQRVWDAALPHVCWIALNPSVANASKPDPTVTRLIGFAKRWGCGGLHVVNLFAVVSPYPMFIDPAKEPFEENDRWILDSAQGCEIVVACWGAEPVAVERGRQVIQNLAREGITDIKCLGKTKDGHPRHPLYLSYDVPLVPYLTEASHA
jgi:hypothetical protein